jgi:hypothetical protein
VDYLTRQNVRLGTQTPQEWANQQLYNATSRTPPNWDAMYNLWESGAHRECLNMRNIEPYELECRRAIHRKLGSTAMALPKELDEIISIHPFRNGVPVMHYLHALFPEKRDLYQRAVRRAIKDTIGRNGPQSALKFLVAGAKPESAEETIAILVAAKNAQMTNPTPEEWLIQEMSTSSEEYAQILLYAASARGEVRLAQYIQKVSEGHLNGDKSLVFIDN